MKTTRIFCSLLSACTEIIGYFLTHDSTFCILICRFHFNFSNSVFSFVFIFIYKEKAGNSKRHTVFLVIVRGVFFRNHYSHSYSFTHTLNLKVFLLQSRISLLFGRGKQRARARIREKKGQASKIVKVKQKDFILFSS